MNTFIRNVRLKLAKNQAKAKQHLEVDLFQFENYLFSSSLLSSKNIRRYSKKYTKKQVNEFMRLMTMKMSLKMKSRLHRYGANRPTIMTKAFETSSSFHVKWGTTGQVQFLFFKGFLLVLIKFSFWGGDWALGYNSMGFCYFPDAY